MPKKVQCSNCGYLCLEETKEIFLGDRTITDANALFPAARQPEYDIEKQYLEITPQNRKDPTGLKESAKDIFCYRHAFLLAQEMKSIATQNLFKKVKTVIEKPRECKYHIQYIPGYSPTQHLMRWENTQREQTNRYWSLIYLLIGAILTIIAGIITKLVLG
jgi:hypothetical protein